MKILNKIKEIEDKYKELKEEINHIGGMNRYDSVAFLLNKMKG